METLRSVGVASPSQLRKKLDDDSRNPALQQAGLKTFTKKSVTPRLAFAFRRRRSGEQSGTVSDVPENDSGEIERTPRAASPESSTEISLRL